MKSIVATFAIVLATWSSVTGAAEYDKSIDVRFPDVIGNLQLHDSKQFPQKELGVNYGYMRPERLVRGSVFVYNGGVSTIPEGTDAPVVRKHFDQVIAEVKSLEQLGQVKSVTLSAAPTQLTAYPGCGPQFLWREYVIDLDGKAPPLKAYTYLTGMGNHFVKLRVTLHAGGPQDERDAMGFVEGVRKVLGKCV